MAVLQSPVNTIGAYRISSQLGRGSSAFVLQAQHELSGDTVAIKWARDASGSDWLARELAVLETLQRAGHPGLVRLCDAGDVHEQQRWLALECLASENLGVRMSRGRARSQAELAERLEIAVQLADALACAHGLGLTHGDLAPANILFREQQPVIIDWATARTCGHAATLLAAVGGGVGTPGFVAPERLRGQDFDSRADLYSLGCVLYELLTGKPPFTSDDLASLERAHLFADALAPSEVWSELPPELDPLLLGLLEKEPRKRLPYALQVALRLERLLKKPRSERRPSPMLPLFKPVLIEREACVNACADMLRASAGASGLSVTLVRGAPGVGLSRVLDALSVEAQQAGFVTVHVQPHGPHPVNPLAVFSAVFEATATLLATGAVADSDLTQLLPLSPYSLHLQRELARRELLAQPVTAPRSREQVFLALQACLQLLAAESPLCLIVDALEAVGDLAAGFLSSLCSHTGRELLRCQVFVATTHDVTWPGALHCEVPALTEQGSAALLEGFLASSLSSSSSALGSLLQSTTDGHPQRVLEFAQRMLLEGALELSPDGQTFSADAERCAQLAEAWDQLPRPLSGEVLQVAALAAASGMTFDLTLLVEVQRVHYGSLPLEASLPDLVASGVLLRLESGRYRFVRDAYRRACLAAVSESMRQALHRALATVLARHAYTGRDYGALGRHWHAAGEPLRAMHCFSRAARRAELTLAVGDAIAHLQAALSLQQEHASWSLRCVRLAVRLLDALSKSARHDELLQLAERLLLQAAPAAQLQRVQALLLAAQSQRILGDYAAAQASLARAELAVQAPDVALDLRSNRAWLDMQLQSMFLAYVQRDLPQLRHRLTAMALPMRRWGSAEQLASYKVWCANELIVRRQYAFDPRAVAFERAALKILSRVSSQSRDACLCQFDLAFMLLLGERAHCVEASEILQQAELHAKPLGDAVLMARIITYRTVALRRLRDVAGCERYAALALHQASVCRLRGYMGAVKGCLAWLALKRDDSPRARRLCQEADVLFTAAGGGSNQAYPFQWVSLLPWLALEIAEDRLEAARVIVGKLLGAGQARLASPLHEELQALDAGWDDFDDGMIARQLTVIVRSATRLCYL